MKITANEASKKTHTVIAKRYVNEVEKCIEKAVAIGRYAAYYRVPESMPIPVEDALVDYIRSFGFSVKVNYYIDLGKGGHEVFYIEW
jgi:ATP-dependent helicase/DNAse subunit B